MKWKGGRLSSNVEDRTTADGSDTETAPTGTPVIGGIYKNKPGSRNTEFNPDDPAEVEVVKELGKKNITKTTPTPTPRPKDNGTHDNLVTPGKWTTKSK